MIGRAKDGSRRGAFGRPWSDENTERLEAMLADPDFNSKTAALALGETPERVLDKIKQMRRRRSNRPTKMPDHGDVDPPEIYEAPLVDFLPGRQKAIETAWKTLLGGASFK